MATSVTFTVKRAVFIASKGKQGPRLGLVFKEDETENLLSSMPISWGHGRLKKYIGKKMREIHLDMFIGSTVEADSFSIQRAGDTYNDAGDVLTKDRLELENPVLVLNSKKAKKALREDADIAKNSDVIHVWSKETAQKAAAKVDLSSAKKKSNAMDDEDDAVVPPKKLKKAVAEDAEL